MARASRSFTSIDSPGANAIQSLVSSRISGTDVCTPLQAAQPIPVLFCREFGSAGLNVEERVIEPASSWQNRAGFGKLKAWSEVFRNVTATSVCAGFPEVTTFASSCRSLGVDCATAIRAKSIAESMTASIFILAHCWKQAMEHSTFSEDNSVSFRTRSSLLSTLMVLYEP